MYRENITLINGKIYRKQNKVSIMHEAGILSIGLHHSSRVV